MLALKNISKSFAGVTALTSVSLSLNRGEVHAVCGENGAGKSTLMNIISGNLRPDAGAIWLDDREVILTNNRIAESHGIAIVHQDRTLVPNLSVAENIFLNRYPTRRFGLIDYKRLYADAREVLASFGLVGIDPHWNVAELSPADQQMIEIAKATMKDPRILIFDEPTASLTDKETDVVFGIIRKLKARGTGILYISHRLAEIEKAADRVTVLKDGRHQGTFGARDLTQEELVSLMVGRKVSQHRYINHRREGRIALQVESLSGHRFQNVSFKVFEGEIVALAGLIGAGRTEIAKTIFGALQRTNGRIFVSGNECNLSSTADAVGHGIAYVPEDRKHQGIFADMSVIDNMLAARYAGSGPVKNISSSEARATADNFRNRLRIVTPSLGKKIRLLSGGNQQKTILARWLGIRPRVLLVDEPTQGVDVGARLEIYDVLQELAAQGTGIVLISSELPEVLALAGRIIVVCEGRIAGELPREEADEEKIMRLAAGVGATQKTNI